MRNPGGRYSTVCICDRQYTGRARVFVIEVSLSLVNVVQDYLRLIDSSDLLFNGLGNFECVASCIPACVPCLSRGISLLLCVKLLLFIFERCKNSLLIYISSII